ncbi:MAG: lysophospholipid acyltransferase family protein [Polyangiaceae bacterium]
MNATPHTPSTFDPFEVQPPLRGDLSGQAWNLARPLFDWAVGFGELRRVYTAAKGEGTLEGFLARALLELGVEWSANELDLSRIPRKGPCVVVANHPFGAIEGIVLATLLRAYRKDVKLVANQLLWRLEAMRDVLLPVEVYGGEHATRSNLSRLRAALKHLKDDGMLALFPSGEVAHFTPESGAVVEAPWNPTVSWLARMANAPVVPVHFAGQASVFVHALGLVHPSLRTALLPRELLRQRGRRIQVRVGAPISAVEARGAAERRRAHQLLAATHAGAGRRLGTATSAGVAAGAERARVVACAGAGAAARPEPHRARNRDFAPREPAGA